MVMGILGAVVSVVITVLIHAFGTTRWVRVLLKRFADRSHRFTPGAARNAVICTALLLLAFHALEIVVWAFAYLLLLPAGQLETFEEAAYFSSITFTCLGYGDVTLTAADWRLLSGVEALDGMLLLGWSTALLFAVVQRIWMSHEASGTTR